MAQANAIMTGWRIGERDFEACDRGTKKAACIGICVAAGLETAFVLGSGYLIQLFTDDVEMIALVRTLMTIDIVLEIGRVSNLVFGQALKTSGDALFTTIIGVIFMYLCMVGGTWFFGIHLNLLAVGAYIGLASDECARGMYVPAVAVRKVADERIYKGRLVCGIIVTQFAEIKFCWLSVATSARYKSAAFLIDLSIRASQESVFSGKSGKRSVFFLAISVIPFPMCLYRYAYYNLFIQMCLHEELFFSEILFKIKEIEVRI